MWYILRVDMFDGIFHYLLPHQKNNYRAKLIHHKSLFIVIIILFFGSFFLSAFRNNVAAVLGDSVDVSSQKLLLLTNQVREENGLPALILNQELSEAAEKKAENMFAENYWAHNSPDGKTPWFFIKQAGYNYVYAGENLAKGFNSSDDVMNAWMQSPTHRDNILSPNYRDIGFAVDTGLLQGETTILVVEEFGSQTLASVAVNNSPKQTVPVSVGSKQLVVNHSTDNLPIKSYGSVLSLSKNIDVILLSLFIFALFMDMIIIEKKNITRFVGHNIDHILFLTIIISFILIFCKGVVI